MSRWALLLLVVLLALSRPVLAQDADGDGLTDAEELSLLETYAPYLYFHPGERYFPVSVQFALDHSVLERYSTTGPPTLVDSSPTPTSLAALDIPADPAVNPGDVYYLNNTRGSVRDDSGILAAYASGAYPATVYARATDLAGQTVVQFWFYYAFNPGVWNDHEGDWEMIQVLLAGGAPRAVAYSQHDAGERMAWTDVSREGSHPRVYVARGSHANYLRPYEGRLGLAGDAVSDAGPRWRPTDYALVNVGEASSPLPGQEWLRFAGRWGEFSLPKEARAEAGPAGPAYREDGAMFAMPVDWANGQPIPDSFVLFLNWFLANLLLIFVLLLLLFGALKLLRLWGLHRRTNAGVRMWPFAHLRPVDRKTAAMLLAVLGLVVGVLGFLLPWYVVTVDVTAPGFLVTDGPEELLKVDGVDGVSVNPMKPGEDAMRVSILPLPLGVLLVVLTLYFFLKVAGTKTSRRLGRRFIGKGVVTVLPFVFVALIAALILPSLPADDPGALGVGDFLRPIVASPLGGSNTIAVEGGSAVIAWGLGLGSWLLVASAVILFVAGILALSQAYSFLPQWYVDGYPSAEEAAARGVFYAPAGVPPPLVPPPQEPPPAPEAIPAAPPEPPPPSAPMEPTPDPLPPPGALPPLCGQCGAPLEPDATVCGTCGAPVT